jgi:hypothetical protein
LFVGAGLSAAAGLPDWKKLLTRVIDETAAEDPSNEADLRELLADEKLLEVADHCKSALGRQRFAEILRDTVGVKVAKLPAVHELLVKLPLPAIVTTNFDKLIETACTQSSGEIPKAPSHSGLAQQGTLLFDDRFFVLKAHGDIDDESSLVFTLSDYRALIHGNTAFQELFAALLMTHAVLFVGYSLNDPDFRLLLDHQLTVFGENIPPRYALMTGVNAVEREVLRRSAQIRVLSYQDPTHGAVKTFLERLTKAIADAAAPPSALPIPPPAAPAAAPASPEPRVTRSGARRRPAEKETTAKDAAELLKEEIRRGDETLWASASRKRSPATEVVALPADSSKDREPRVLPRPELLPTAVLRLEQRRQQLEASLAHVGWMQGVSKAPQLAAFATDLPRTLHNEDTRGATMQKIGKLLASCLPAEILAAIEELPADLLVSLELIGEPELLPWEWLAIGGHPLAESHPVVRIPVEVPAGARGFPAVRHPLRALLVGDPGGDGIQLAGARAEVEAIAALLRGSGLAAEPKVLSDRDANLRSVGQALSESQFDIVHFAGHAWFDERESYVQLSDDQVWAGELQTFLGSRPPALLVLNSHYTAFVPPGIAHEQGSSAIVRRPRGFTRMATAAGIGAFVGCFGSPLDEPAKGFGVELYRQLLAGEPFAIALYRSRNAFSRPAKGELTGSFYAGSGHPELRLA